jgi:hypothetical protein
MLELLERLKYPDQIKKIYQKDPSKHSKETNQINIKIYIDINPRPAAGPRRGQRGAEARQGRRPPQPLRDVRRGARAREMEAGAQGGAVCTPWASSCAPLYRLYRLHIMYTDCMLHKYAIYIDMIY